MLVTINTNGNNSRMLLIILIVITMIIIIEYNFREMCGHIYWKASWTSQKTHGTRAFGTLQYQTMQSLEVQTTFRPREKVWARTSLEARVIQIKHCLDRGVNLGINPLRSKTNDVNRISIWLKYIYIYYIYIYDSNWAMSKNSSSDDKVYYGNVSQCMVRDTVGLAFAQM